MTDRVGTNELLVTICGQVEARLATRPDRNWTAPLFGVRNKPTGK